MVFPLVQMPKNSLWILILHTKNHLVEKSVLISIAS